MEVGGRFGLIILRYIEKMKYYIEVRKNGLDSGVFTYLDVLLSEKIEKKVESGKKFYIIVIY